MKKIDRNIVSTLVFLGNEEFTFVCDLLQKNNPIQKGGISEDFLKRAQTGFAENQFLISKFYEWGIGFNEDLNESYNWVMKSFKNKYPPSIFSVANFYYEGFLSLDQNYSKFLELCVESAESDYIPALTLLGYYYKEGDTFLRCDIEESIQYYKKAEKLGSTKAIVSLFKIYADINELNNINLYINKIRVAAENGCHLAHEQLGRLYFTGCCGVEKNKEKSLKHQALSMEIIQSRAQSYVNLLKIS